MIGRRALLGIIVGLCLASPWDVHATDLGPVPDQALVAQAKAEGQVGLYGAIGQAQLTEIAQRFQATYGITVHTLRVESDKLPGRILTELRGGHSDCDIMGDGGFQVDQLKRLGILATYRPPENAAMLPGTVDPDGTWTAAILNTEAMGYNPTRAKELGIPAPQRWEDLTRKEWHGQFGIFTGSYEWYAAMKKYYGREKATALLRAYASNTPRLLVSKQLGISLIEAGEIVAAPNLYGYDVWSAQNAGQHIALVNPVPIVVELYPIAILKSAPHPNAARLFMRWWLSRETQVWAHDHLHRLSARKDVVNTPDLLGPKTPYVFSVPSDSVEYNDDVHEFNEIFNIPG